MSFKKIAIISLSLYLLIGIAVFTNYSSNKKSDSKSTYTIDESLYVWNVNDESLGDYSSPAWLRDPELLKYTHEVHYSDTPDFKPVKFVEYQLMSLFAQLQLGDPLLASSYINPEISYKDYDVRLPLQMEEQASKYRDTITKNQSIQLVTLKIIEETESSKVFEVSLNYTDETSVSFPLTMINLANTEEHAEDYEEYEEYQEYEEDDIHDQDTMWFISVGLNTIQTYIN